MSNFTKLGAAFLVIASLSACAGKPKPAFPVTEQPAAPEASTAPASQPSAPVNTSAIRPGSAQDFVINVGDRVYFDVDQSGLRADARALLDAQAAWLGRYQAVKVRIEGNCDERGTREYNFALGARRAQAAMDYLVSRGVTPNRITTISYGKEQPVAAEASEEAWGKNRNARTSITQGAQ